MSFGWCDLGVQFLQAAAAAQEEDRDWLRHQGLTESTEEEAEGVGQGREGEDGSGEGRDTSQRAGAGERDDEVIDSRRVGQEGSTSGESGERERQVCAELRSSRMGALQSRPVVFE